MVLQGLIFFNNFFFGRGSGGLKKTECLSLASHDATAGTSGIT